MVAEVSPVQAATLQADGGVEPAAKPKSAAEERLAEFALALLTTGTFATGGAIVLFWVIDAIFWHVLVPQNPQALNPVLTLAPPSAAHWFGTDDLGRDVFARMLAGAASVLTVAPAATLLGLVGGTLIGLCTGYYRGLIDEVVMRVMDAVLAFPLIVIAVLVLAVLGPSVINVILVIGFVFMPLRRAHRARRRARRTRARICRGGAAARQLRPLHHVRRDPAEHHRRRSRSRSRSASATPSSPRRRSPSSRSACSSLRRTGACPSASAAPPASRALGRAVPGGGPRDAHHCRQPGGGRPAAGAPGMTVAATPCWRSRA